MLSALVDRIEALTNKVDAVPAFGWATVTSVDPLRVRPGGHADELQTTPAAIYRPTSVGQRVLYLAAYRRVTVLGPATGLQGLDAVPDNSIKIGDQWYPASGSRTLPDPGSPALSGNNMFVWQYVVAQPFIAPPGYGFSWSLKHSTGYSVLGQALHSDPEKTILRLVNFFSSAPRNIQVTWRLVKT